MDTSSDPNYQTITPPEDKPPSEYSWAERRGELFDLIEEAGHHRRLEKSQRELGNRYGVSRKTIQKDIKRLNAWKADRMGADADSELVTLYNKAVQYHLDNNDPDKAYEIANTHYGTLMDAANATGQQREADRHEHSGPGGDNPIQVTVQRTAVESASKNNPDPDSDSDEDNVDSE